MALEALIPIAIEGAKLAFSASSGNKSAKKQANIQSDYSEHVQRLTDVFNSNVEQYSAYLTSADNSFLDSVYSNLKSQVDQNPYALDGEQAPSGLKIQTQYNGVPISKYNTQIKTLFENYIENRGQTPATSNLIPEGSTLVANGSQSTMPAIQSLLNTSKTPVVVTQEQDSTSPYLIPIAIVSAGLLIFLIARR